MATMVGARGTKTTLKIGAVEAPVILHGTVAAQEALSDYATAGPNGRPLRHAMRAVAAPVEEAPEGDAVPLKRGTPLSPTGRPAPAAEDVVDAVPGPPVATEDRGPGEFRQVLIEQPGEGESEDDMPALKPDDLRRGIRQEDGAFIDLTAQLADIEKRTKLDRMEVVYTMDVGQVPRSRVMGTYYVSGDDPAAPHVLRVFMEALRKARRVAVVKWTAKTRQSLGVVTVDGTTGALVLLKLAWAEDVREPGQKQLAHLQASAYVEEVDAMAELLVALREPRRLGLDTMRDDARALREELDAKAKAGELAQFALEPELEPVPDRSLADMLQASIEQVAARAA